MSMMIPPPAREPSRPTEQPYHAQHASEQQISTQQITEAMSALPPASQPPPSLASASMEYGSPEGEPGMPRSASLAQLAALLKSPSLEGLDSWETIHPELLPEFTPRFTVTAGPQLAPQLQGEHQPME